MKFEWESTKNEWLKTERNLSFEDAELAIKSPALLDIVINPAHPDSHMFVVRIHGYVCLVPFRVIGDVIKLYTVIPSRKANKKYAQK